MRCIYRRGLGFCTVRSVRNLGYRMGDVNKAIVTGNGLFFRVKELDFQASQFSRDNSA